MTQVEELKGLVAKKNYEDAGYLMSAVNALLQIFDGHKKKYARIEKAFLEVDKLKSDLKNFIFRDFSE